MLTFYIVLLLKIGKISVYEIKPSHQFSKVLYEYRMKRIEKWKSGKTGSVPMNYSKHQIAF